MMAFIKLSEVCSKIGSGKTPRGGNSVYKNLGTPFIRSQNVLLGSFSCDGLAFIDNDQAYDLRNVTVEGSDVLINITGDSTARVCIPPANLIPARVNQHVAILRPLPDKLDSNYLLYVLISKEYQDKLLSLASAGATRLAITKQMLDDLQIPYPDFKIQTSIGSTLRTLDKKIALNNQINQTLEAITKAIFKEWFIDFGPVKAKAENKKPFGMDEETAALFPDSFEESEFGMIPKNWRIKQIVDFCLKVKSGGTPNRTISEYWKGGNIPWLSSGEVHDKWILKTKEKITEKGKENSNTDYLPIFSTIVAMYGATAGKVSFSTIELTTNQACCGLIPLKNHEIFNFILLSRLEKELLNLANGAAQQNINQQIIKDFKVISPTSSIIIKFQNLCEPFIKKILNNKKENNYLMELRDILLPKLLSGELSV